MFSQYGSNMTPEGDVFKQLGAVVAAVQTEVSLGAPACSNLSELPSSPTVIADISSARQDDKRQELGLVTPSSGSVFGEADCNRERRSKSSQDRPARVLARSRD